MSVTSNAALWSTLWNGAKTSLESNLEKVGSETYMTAGRNQFRSLWSRDFCYASRGLLVLGQHEVVRDQLTLLLQNRRKNSDGSALIPRTLDSIPAKWRVSRVVASRIIPFLHRELPLKAFLKPEYLSENGTEAIDSNVLLLMAADFYLEKTGDQSWWSTHRGALLEVFRYYGLRTSAGLIAQPGFSDWQDSVRRSGAVFLTNLLYWHVQSRLLKRREFGITEVQVQNFKQEIEKKFFDKSTGLYRSVENREQISLEGVLMALDLGFVAGDEALQLFRSLQKHALWKSHDGLPGFATSPDYDSKDVSLPTKWVGLDHYHDRLYWSWLLGYSLKVAIKMGDSTTVQKITSFLESALARDGSIVELYDPENDFKPWSSFWLEAERPFSWGAAFILDALGSASS